MHGKGWRQDQELPSELLHFPHLNDLGSRTPSSCHLSYFSKRGYLSVPSVSIANESLIMRWRTVARHVEGLVGKLKVPYAVAYVQEGVILHPIVPLDV